MRLQSAAALDEAHLRPILVSVTVFDSASLPTQYQAEWFLMLCLAVVVVRLVSPPPPNPFVTLD